MITSEKLRKECSSSYRLGYRTAVRDVVLKMKAIESPQSQENQIFLDKCINHVMDYLKSYPFPLLEIPHEHNG